MRTIATLLTGPVFFLVCVAIAGVFGGFTAKTSILVTQALPALLALAAYFSSRASSSHAGLG